MNIFIFFSLLLVSCTGIPKGMQAVDGFEASRYMGTWYEIARLDHFFERGLENISATYAIRDDGGIDIVNKGKKKSGEWKTAKGRAYFIDRPTIGRFKVSFFGPLYGSYNIVALDKDNYSYAMVIGPTKSYLWFLSRSRQMPKAIFDELMAYAKNRGFATDKMIIVNQSQN
ncbi:MAG: lipocalin family protein [Gammaproteobacteria bacterium]